MQAAVLREWLKLVLLGDNTQQIAVHLTGLPGCGKSKFAELLMSILGNESTAIEIHHTSSTFGLGPVVGTKLVVIGDLPVDGMTPKRSSNIRLLISGDPVRIDVKYMKSFNYVFKGNMLFHSNISLLSSSSTPEDQGGLARRLLELPWNTIPPVQMSDLLERLEEDKLAIIWWALTSNLDKGFLPKCVHDLNHILPNEVRDDFTDFAVKRLKVNPNKSLNLGIKSVEKADTFWSTYTDYCDEQEIEKCSGHVFSNLLLKLQSRPFLRQKRLLKR